MKVIFAYKGGKGSGFHGHAGRPGKQGGSSSTGGSTVNVTGNFTEGALSTIQSVHKRITQEFPTLDIKGIVTNERAFMEWNTWDKTIEIGKWYAMHPDASFEDTLIHEYGHTIVDNIRKNANKGEFFDTVNELMTKLPSPSKYADDRGRPEWIPERFLAEFTGKADKVLIPLMHKYMD